MIKKIAPKKYKLLFSSSLNSHEEVLKPESRVESDNNEEMYKKKKEREFTSVWCGQSRF